MFDSLRKKLSGWLGKEVTPTSSKKTKPKEKKVKKETKKPVEKPVKVEKRKRSKQELKEERKISTDLIEDIKKERGDDIQPIPRQEEIIEALEQQEAREKEK